MNVHVIISEAEMNVLTNIQEKEKRHKTMQKEMIEIMSDIAKAELFNLEKKKNDYIPQQEMKLPSFI